MTVCMENTFHPQNASALVRNCEAFGVQELHAVEELCRFSPNVQIVRGTDKWIEIRKHPTTAELIGSLRGRGYRIVATTPHLDDATPETFDVAAGPFALFLRHRARRYQRRGEGRGGRIPAHPDVRDGRKPQCVGLGGDPALLAFDPRPRDGHSGRYGRRVHCGRSGPGGVAAFASRPRRGALPLDAGRPCAIRPGC